MHRFQNVAIWTGLRVASLLAFLALLSAFERPAYGYTDPGSGALIWQMLMAGLVGASFYFRRIVSWLKRRKKTSSVDEA
jgi:hypothetical protein